MCNIEKSAMEMLMKISAAKEREMLFFEVLKVSSV